MPQIATGYGKMLPENDCTEPVITNKTGEKVNEITGSSGSKRSPPPLTTTGFELIKKKAPSVALVNENTTLPVTSHPGWYGQSRSKRLSNLHNRF